MQARKVHFVYKLWEFLLEHLCCWGWEDNCELFYSLEHLCSLVGILVTISFMKCCTRYSATCVSTGKGRCYCGSLWNVTSIDAWWWARLCSGFSCVPDIAELLLSYYIFNNAAQGQQGGQEWQQMVVGQCPRQVGGGNSMDMASLHWSHSTCAYQPTSA